MANFCRKPIFYIFILGLILRLLFLDSNPAGFFRDEAAKGYNAYCLYKTGKNIDGHFLPIFTRELATYNSALYSYLIIPFIIVLGLTETAVRFPAVLAGILTILALYWMLKQVYNEKMAIIASCLLAVSPWHLLFSRWANQGILLPLFLMVGLGCFLYFIKDSKPDKSFIFLPFSFIFWAISFYTYDVSKVFVPLFLIGLWIIYRKELMNSKTYFIISLLFFIVILIPVIQFTLLSDIQSQARFQRISLWSQSGNILQFLWQFFKNWLSHYFPGFLFIHGDSNIRHTLPLTGQLYLFELPFFLIGIYRLWKEKSPINSFFLYWLVIYPIPASLTTEGIPHALRAITGIPIMIIITVKGIHYLLEKYPILFHSVMNTKKQILSALCIFLITFNIVLVLYLFYTVYPAQSALAFQDGMKEAVQYTESAKSDYSKIIISPSLGFAEIFFLFYTQYPPQNLNQPHWSNYYFDLDSPQIREDFFNKEKPVLLLVSPSEMTNYRPIKVIFGPKGIPVLKFISNQ